MTIFNVSNTGPCLMYDHNFIRNLRHQLALRKDLPSQYQKKRTFLYLKLILRIKNNDIYLNVFSAIPCTTSTII